jgi:hypothetical protein
VLERGNCSKEHTSIVLECAVQCFWPVHSESPFRSLWSRASKRVQRPLCFCAVFSYSFFFYYGRARASACSDHYVFALFFRIPFFLFFLFFYFFFYFLCHEICRKVIVSNAFAYGTEIWQVDSLWKYADRMFISHKSAEGFQRGRDA